MFFTMPNTIMTHPNAIKNLDKKKSSPRSLVLYTSAPGNMNITYTAAVHPLRLMTTQMSGKTIDSTYSPRTKAKLKHTNFRCPSSVRDPKRYDEAVSRSAQFSIGNDETITSRYKTRTPKHRMLAMGSGR